MTSAMLYPIISKGMAILYWPTFFFCLWAIEKANKVENE
tara:strand:+ start:88 stop:204 length:117 start_codon:yes stop_codon:yes gene_type:complete